MEVPLRERDLEQLIREMRNLEHSPLIDFPRYLHGDRSQPHWKLAQELVEECRDYIAILGEDEIRALREQVAVGMRFKDWENPTISKERKTRLLAEAYVQHELQERFFHIEHVLDEPESKSKVLEEYPELENRLDDDGLLILGGGLEPVDGAILYKDHALSYHQFLRRGFTSRPNYDFLVPFLRYYRESNEINEFRIAIDHSRLMRREHYSRALEFDRWYGPPYDESKLDDPEAVGLTVYRRNPASLFTLTNDLQFTDFLWTFHEGIKTFQIEEVHSKKDALGDFVVNRYLHSERDTTKGAFRHIDGAAKVYRLAQYNSRMETNLPDARRCYAKPKLWRIDGDIDVERWSMLISFFYKSNEMIIEYFDPDAFLELFELRVRDFERWKKEQEALPE